MKAIQSFIFCLGLTVVSDIAAGQGDGQPGAFEFADTVVTVNRRSSALRESGKSITVITRQELERSHRHRLIDALQQVPGLYLANTGVNGTASLFLRGGEQYHSKILLNGVPVQDVSATQVSAQAFLANLSVDNVERIEVLRGAQSALYGSDAIGGVINIITQVPTDELAGSVSAEIGEHGHERLSTELRGQQGAVDYALAVSRAAEDGITADNRAGQEDKDDYANVTLDGRLGLQIAPSTRLNFIGRFIDVDQEFDNSFGSQFQDSHQQSVFARMELRLDDRANERWDQVLGVSFTDNQRASRGPGFFDNNKFDGEILRIDWTHTLALADWSTLAFGVDYEEQRTHGDSTQVNERVRVAEYFVQEELAFDDRFFLTMGLRYTQHALFGEHYSYDVTPTYLIESTNTKLRASYATGYRAPSPFELYAPPFPGFFEGGNPALEPEENESWEVGFEQSMADGRFHFGMTYFYSETDNSIIFFVAPFPQLSDYRNSGLSRSYGVESYANWQVNDALALRMSYTRLHTESEIQGDSDVRLPRRPRNAFNLAVDYDVTERLYLHGGLSYRGRAYDNSANTVSLDHYTLVDLAVTYALRDDVELYLRVHNLLNENYETAANFETLERTFYGGVRVSF